MVKRRCRPIFRTLKDLRSMRITKRVLCCRSQDTAFWERQVSSNKRPWFVLFGIFLTVAIIALSVA